VQRLADGRSLVRALNADPIAAGRPSYQVTCVGSISNQKVYAVSPTVWLRPNCLIVFGFNPFGSRQRSADI
jgi:hypothetical protein